MEALEQTFKLIGLDAPASNETLLHNFNRPIEVYRICLVKILSDILECEEEVAQRCILWPNNIDNGDLAIVLPKLRPGVKADKTAVEIMEKFPNDHPLFLLPFLDGVQLRVFANPSNLARLLLPYILKQESSYGSFTSEVTVTKTHQKLLVELSSPNIYSEFHGRHLRSTIIGAFLSRLYESFGWDVTRISYLGDWGKPIALLYIGWTKFGSQEAYDTDPVGHLLEIYHRIDALFQPEQAASRQARDNAAKEGNDEGEAQAEIEGKGIFAKRNEAFKKLEEGDEELKAFWERTRNVIVEDYDHFFARLGVRFDEYTGESQVSATTMAEVEQLLKDNNIVEESAGALMVDMTKLGAKAGHAIVRDRSGSSTYLLRDLAAVLERSRKYSFDKMIYVVASDNSVHFNQMFKILEALDKDLANKLQHVKFSEVSKMSASIGRGYKPQAILDKCEEAISSLAEADADKLALLGTSEQASKALATSSLLVQELAARSVSVHAFDTASMATFKLGSGPDIQYWHAKISSLLSDRNITATLSDEDYGVLAEEEDQVNLLRLLAQYPEVVNATYHSLESSGITTYIASVTEQLSDCLDEEEGEVEVTPGFTALLEATRIVLANGMRLLGMSPIYDLPPERADTPVAE
ncbi:hypothetical protein DE146DRAFT_716202 [Phaeosphaeria sp. MPI-PUGE-AT-0046c]|nr:hypothetical protein DE146DRAFT_716202 [Phaeosphaeria sp. MPI-PUGE-AT-0046c]